MEVPTSRGHAGPGSRCHLGMSADRGAQRRWELPVLEPQPALGESASASQNEGRSELEQLHASRSMTRAAGPVHQRRMGRVGERGTST